MWVPILEIRAKIEGYHQAGQAKAEGARDRPQRQQPILNHRK